MDNNGPEDKLYRGIIHSGYGDMIGEGWVRLVNGGAFYRSDAGECQWYPEHAIDRVVYVSVTPYTPMTGSVKFCGKVDPHPAHDWLDTDEGPGGATKLCRGCTLFRD